MKINKNKISAVSAILFTALFQIGCSNPILYKPSPYIDPMPEDSSEDTTLKSEAKPYEKLWNMKSIGMTTELSQKADYQGNVNIKVAILSTGVDYNHRDLKDAIIVNKKEISVEASGRRYLNRRDDDGDGKKDNIVGWDVVNGDGLAYDRHGTGTAIAGIIAAKANKEMRGIVQKISLYPIKYIDDNGQSSVSLVVAGIQEAIRIKPDIIYIQQIDLQEPNSDGDPEKRKLHKRLLKAAVKELIESNITTVIAAGEDMKTFGNTEVEKMLSRGKNIFIVSSIDKKNQIPFLANRGFKSVTIFAPGENIRTTALRNKYQSVSGTPYAAAHVVAALALAKSIFGKDKSNLVLASALISPEGGNKQVHLKRDSKGGTSLNIKKFLQALSRKK